MGRSTISQQDTVFVCPSCHADVEGTFVLSVGELKLESGIGTAKVELAGVRVNHDCIPKVTREAVPDAPRRR
jgi:hypothetical protein